MSNYNHFGNEYYYSTYPMAVASGKCAPVSDPLLSRESYYVPNGYVDECGISSSQPVPSVEPNTTSPLQIPFSPSQVQYQVYEYTNVSAVSSWSPEYNMPGAPPSMPSMPSSWTPSSPTTAELSPDPLFSSPSITDDFTNMFDPQVGYSLQSQDLGCNFSSSSVGSPEPYTPREIVRPTTTSKKPIRSRDDQSSSRRRRHPCLIPGCQRRFTNQYTLGKHLQAHKPKPRVSFLCALGCGRRFSRQHDRLRHEVAQHGKVCEFSCEACGRFFSMAKTLNNHKCVLVPGATRWIYHGTQ